MRPSCKVTAVTLYVSHCHWSLGSMHSAGAAEKVEMFLFGSNLLLSLFYKDRTAANRAHVAS